MAGTLLHKSRKIEHCYIVKIDAIDTRHVKIGKRAKGAGGCPEDKKKTAPFPGAVIAQL